MGSRSASSALSSHFTPSDLDQSSDLMAQAVKAVKTHEQNRVIEGCKAIDPTTASSQLAGVGNTTWNVDFIGGRVVVGGVVATLDDQADLAIHSGSLLGADGRSCIAALVAKNVAGTVSIQAVKGTVALTAAVLPPSDAAIQAAVGAGNPWILLSVCQFNRTGDATCTQAQNNNQLPVLGVNVDTGFGYGL